MRRIFGSMMTACLLMSGLAWGQGVVARPGPVGSDVSTPEGRFGYLSDTPWFSHPSVRKELRLSDRQLSELNRAYEQAWTRYNKERNLFKDHLTPEQRQQREGELWQGFHKHFSPVVQSTFTDPAVRQRYDQLYLQYQGYDAFHDPAIREKLNLTRVQQQQLDQQSRLWNQQLNRWRREYATNQAQIDKEYREARVQAEQRLKTILTPEQKTTWDTLIGNTYDFPSDVYFPPAPTSTTTLKPVTK